MRGLSIVSLLAAVPALASAALLENNIAYRSPSLTVDSNGLAHDIEAIERRHIKRDGQSERFLGNLSFPYGVASGDPYDDSAIIWTIPVSVNSTIKVPVCLRYETSRVEGSFANKDLADRGVVCTTKDVGYSVKVETKNLKPKTQYWYRFVSVVGKQASPVGRFKTMPTPDDAEFKELNLAVFSCSNLPYGSFASYANAARKTELDYSVHVGDYIYEGKPVVGAPESRQFEPRREISTLEDYRQRYAAYHSKDASLRALRASMAWLLVWDDHDAVADNTWKSGSADSNDTVAGEVNGVQFSERKRNSVKAYFENMPIRQVDSTDKLRIWRQFRIGKLADLNMLDTRLYARDVTDIYYNTAYVESISNDTERTLMGGKQEKWLYNKLATSQATWKIIAQQVIVSQMHNLQKPKKGVKFDLNYDAWSGYTANRKRLYEAIKKTDNVVILAGDTHAAWAFETEDDLDESKYDAVTGEGSLAVEFAGTAVSSTSSYGRNLTSAQYLAKAQALVGGNKNLQFAEGEKRGYFTLRFTPTELTTKYYGIDDNNNGQSTESLLATFEVKRGANKFTRPINGGKNSTHGALQSLQYDQSSWNGTYFTVAK